MKDKWTSALVLGVLFAGSALADQGTGQEPVEPELEVPEISEIRPALSVADYEADQTGRIVDPNTLEDEPAEYAALGTAQVVMDSDEPEVSFSFEDARVNIAEY